MNSYSALVAGVALGFSGALLGIAFFGSTDSYGGAIQSYQGLIGAAFTLWAALLAWFAVDRQISQREIETKSRERAAVVGARVRLLLLLNELSNYAKICSTAHRYCIQLAASSEMYRKYAVPDKPLNIPSLRDYVVEALVTTSEKLGSKEQLWVLALAHHYQLHRARISDALDPFLGGTDDGPELLEHAVYIGDTIFLERLIVLLYRFARTGKTDDLISLDADEIVNESGLYAEIREETDDEVQQGILDRVRRSVDANVKRQHLHLLAVGSIGDPAPMMVLKSR